MLMKVLEIRKEKTKVKNKILYYQKNLRNQKILNKINPLNCSFDDIVEIVGEK